MCANHAGVFVWINNLLTIYSEKGNNSHLRLGHGFPGGSVVENPSANAGDMGLVADSGRCPLPQSS